MLLAADEPATFALAIRDGAVPRAQRELKVPHEARVRIEWSADRPMIVHLEGYDLAVEVRPGKPQVMEFTAFATGRFPVHAHEGEQRGRHAHGALLWLEVHPK